MKELWRGSKVFNISPKIEDNTGKLFFDHLLNAATNNDISFFVKFYSETTIVIKKFFSQKFL